MPGSILCALHVSEESSTQEEAKRNEEKQAILTYLIKMGSNSHFWSHFSWKMVQQLKSFSFFRYYLTAKTFLVLQTFSEDLGSPRKIQKDLFLSRSSSPFIGAGIQVPVGNSWKNIFEDDVIDDVSGFPILIPFQNPNAASKFFFKIRVP